MPKEHFGSSKHTYFSLQNINTKPFVLLSKSLGCHANEQHVTWEWKAGNDTGQKLVIVLQLTQCNNYGWEPRKWDTNLRGWHSCQVREPRGCQKAHQDSHRLLAELLTPGQVLHNPHGPLGWKPGQLDAKLLSVVFFPLQTVLVFCQLGEKQDLSFGTELRENFHSVTQEWLLSFWTGNICDGEVSAAPRIGSWYLWRRVGSYFEAMTWDLKYL